MVEGEAELRIEHVVFILGAQFRGFDRDRVTLRRRGEGKPDGHGQTQQAEKAVRWRHARSGGEPRDPDED
jgi:hypothetical protein